jgi:hypothetical protein
MVLKSYYALGPGVGAPPSQGGSSLSWEAI